MTSSILRDTPAPITRVRADLPGDLERIASRCLEKNPRERFQTALDVSNELRRLRRLVERGESTAPAPEKVASIAVLPFVNRSQNVEDEYFSDGLADELLTMLAKIKGLRVSARSSSFHFKGKDAPIEEVGRALGVATVLDGSVRKAGNRVRISVQLVRVSDGDPLWSEEYDRTLDDIFAVQDDIAHAVVKELRTTLLGEAVDSHVSGQVKAEVAQPARGRATDPEAHRLYFLGRHFLDRGAREDVAKAIAYLSEALDRDPEFALAWVELAQSCAREADAGWVPVEEAYGRARDLLERAFTLEPDLPEGHALMGRIRMLHDWDWRGADASYGRALELAPGNAAALRGAGALAMNSDRQEEAIALLRRSLERDPLRPGAYISLAMSLIAANRFEEAEAVCRKGIEVAPQYVATRSELALALLGQGNGEEARAEASQEVHPGFRLWALTMIDHILGRKTESDEELRELIEKGAEDGAFQIAEVLAVRGESDAAFEWLERAYAQRDGGLAETKSSPRLRSLHGDARWSGFLRKMGFET